MSLNVKNDFSRFLKRSLLSDNYGGWPKLDPNFFDNLCDRMGSEVEKYIEGNESLYDKLMMTKESKPLTLIDIRP